MGFEINPYDPCVANMMINWGHISICWHADNLKISHSDKAIVNEFTMELVDEFNQRPLYPGGKCTII